MKTRLIFRVFLTINRNTWTIFVLPSKFCWLQFLPRPETRRWWHRAARRTTFYLLQLEKHFYKNLDDSSKTCTLRRRACGRLQSSKYFSRPKFRQSAEPMKSRILCHNLLSKRLSEQKTFRFKLLFEMTEIRLKIFHYD